MHGKTLFWACGQGTWGGGISGKNCSRASGWSRWKFVATNRIQWNKATNYAAVPEMIQQVAGMKQSVSGMKRQNSYVDCPLKILLRNKTCRGWWNTGWNPKWCHHQPTLQRQCITSYLAWLIRRKQWRTKQWWICSKFPKVIYIELPAVKSTPEEASWWVRSSRVYRSWKNMGSRW